MGREREILYHLVHSPNGLQWPGMGQADIKSQEVYTALLYRYHGIKYLDHLHYLPRHIRRNPGLHWYSRDFNWYSHMECQHSKQWIKLLCHSAGIQSDFSKTALLRNNSHTWHSPSCGQHCGIIAKATTFEISIPYGCQFMPWLLHFLSISLRDGLLKAAEDGPVFGSLLPT